MATPLKRTPEERPATVRFSGDPYECLPAETVLDALLRHGVDAPHSCRKGTCLSCMMRVTDGEAPPRSQQGLGETLRDQGYFLPCKCVPAGDMVVASPEQAAGFNRAGVAAVETLSPSVKRVLLERPSHLDYHAGQFVNLRRDDGLVRSYSLASVPGIDPVLELHIKHWPGGRMSSWIFEGLRPGTTLEVQGPNGVSYYLPGREEQPLILIGNGTGLAPLIGIARDALHRGHGGPIHLYHGTRHADGLYMRPDLNELAARHENFRFVPCLSGQESAGCRVGRAETTAFADHPDLRDYRVFLCGHPEMVRAARKKAYLARANLADIHADPFDFDTKDEG